MLQTEVRTEWETRELASAFCHRGRGPQDAGVARFVLGACDVKAGLAGLVAGDRVVASETFWSDSAVPALILEQERGLVVQLDADGDALIDFETHTSRRWVFRRNLEKLALQGSPRPPIIHGEEWLARSAARIAAGSAGDRINSILHIGFII